MNVHNKVHPHSGQHPSYHGSRQPPLDPGPHAQGHEIADEEEQVQQAVFSFISIIIHHNWFDIKKFNKC